MCRSSVETIVTKTTYSLRKYKYQYVRIRQIHQNVSFVDLFGPFLFIELLELIVREHSLMTSIIRVGGGSKIKQKKGHYRVGQGR